MTSLVVKVSHTIDDEVPMVQTWRAKRKFVLAGYARHHFANLSMSNPSARSIKVELVLIPSTGEPWSEDEPEALDID